LKGTASSVGVGKADTGRRVLCHQRASPGNTAAFGERDLFRTASQYPRVKDCELNEKDQGDDWAGVKAPACGGNLAKRNGGGTGRQNFITLMGTKGERRTRMTFRWVSIGRWALGTHGHRAMGGPPRAKKAATTMGCNLTSR